MCSIIFSYGKQFVQSHLYCLHCISSIEPISCDYWTCWLNAHGLAISCNQYGGHTYEIFPAYCSIQVCQLLYCSAFWQLQSYRYCISLDLVAQDMAMALTWIRKSASVQHILNLKIISTIIPQQLYLWVFLNRFFIFFPDAEVFCSLKNI